MEDPDAGFILAMVAFPLLERYLRRESGSVPKQKLFQDAVLKFLPELKTARQAKEFWESYRHGLLHNVMLNGVEDWLSHETAIIEKRPKGFLMNPVLFAERVLERIRGDFETFAKDPGLPEVKSVPRSAPLGPLMGVGITIPSVIGTAGRR
jgi:hypothetical protein